MKKGLLVVLTFSAILLFPVSSYAGELIAAQFYADWCTSCKVLAPALEEVKEKYQDGNVKFIKFDKTSDSTDATSYNLAKELGIGGVYKAHPKTGFVLLIDEGTNHVVGKLTKDMPIDKMAMVLDGALMGKDMMKGSMMEEKGSMMKKKTVPMKKGSMKKGS